MVVDLLSLPRFLFLLLLEFPLQVLSETILDTSSPSLRRYFPSAWRSVPFRPLSPVSGLERGAGRHRVVSEQLG